MSYRLENGELYPRATHPGSGEAAYWPEGETYTNTGQWPGAMITRETAQNLIQDKAPITLQEWHTRYRDTPDAIETTGSLTTKQAGLIGQISSMADKQPLIS